MKRKYIVYAIGCFVILIVIFILSNQAGTESHALSTYIGDMLSDTFVGHLISRSGFTFRNVAHILLYFLLGLLSALTLLNVFKRAGKYSIYFMTTAYSLIACFLFAAFDEWHQTFIPGRNGCVSDVFIDAVGFGSGIVATEIVHFIYSRIHEKVKSRRIHEEVALMAEHHNLDISPVPEKAMYINETGIADTSTYELPKDKKDEDEEDNVRVYIPLDLNQSAILRRLHEIEYRLGDPTEYNEFTYSSEVQRIINQLEIYDQLWFTKEGYDSDESGEHLHSRHAKELAEKILDEMEGWAENSSAECFPFEEIDELEEDYGIKRDNWWD